jgi:hypothetical protein
MATLTRSTKPCSSQKGKTASKSTSSYAAATFRFFFFFTVQVSKFLLLKALKYAFKDTQLLFCYFQLLFIVEVLKFLLSKALSLNIASKNTHLYFVVAVGFRL